MNDLFARIGTVLERLLSVSTVNGDARTEALRLCQELQSAPDDIAKQIDARVEANIEAAVGRLAALEQGKRQTDAIVFSTSNAKSLGLPVPEPTKDEHDRLRELFNGADPAMFDHDGDGRPGGSLPEPAPNPEPAADPAPEPAPKEEPAPAPEPPTIEAMDREELKALADLAGIEFAANIGTEKLRALVAAIPLGIATDPGL